MDDLRCERTLSHGVYGKAATHILRRQCPHCGWHQVLNICQECHDYIVARNERARKGDVRYWRCLKCGKNRPMPQGMDILGTVKEVT
jgi:hypothetical protein